MSKNNIYIYMILLMACNVTLVKGQSNYYTLSSRWFHPRNSQDTLSTMRVIKQLHPGRIDWTYCENEKQLNLYKEAGLEYSLTMNPQIPDSLEYTTGKFRMKDFAGRLYIAPWMKAWNQKNPYWGCVNNPHFYELYLKKALKLASLGPYAIMVDDALFNIRYRHEKLVGCFCYYCIEGFKKEEKITDKEIELLKQSIKNFHEKGIPYNVEQKKLTGKYEIFQERSVIFFFRKWKNEIKDDYPNMLFLTNNYNGNWNSVYKEFDGGIAEIKPQYINEKDLDSLYTVADQLGKTQIFSVVSDDMELHFHLMEYNAKHRRVTLLPWDIFIPNSDRYYIKIETLKNKMSELYTKYNY